MSRILLIEDHEQLARLVSKGLAGAGIVADEVTTNDSAWAALRQVDYHCLILDRGLPDGDGLNLLRHIRQGGLTVPCLILTARDALHDRVEGLEAGGDDYLPKPFAMAELVARVRALLRRPAITKSLRPCYQDLMLFPEGGAMQCGERSITLAAAEMQIMLALVNRQGEVVRRSAMEAVAWGLSDAVTPNALDVALPRIRRKLQSVGSRLQIINVRGQGYALL
ncbi:response regulator transcription factor [Pantoea sp.]|uniref:response regulator transcription factor n=1 Tax=Pantoea sp. TaxID=69393 RepID=UPI0028B112E3|nr:response regulator transcription factor [Pantoea sp.]